MHPIASRSALLVRALGRSCRRHWIPLLVTLLWSLSLCWWEGERMWGSHSPAFEPERLMGVLDAWRHGIWDARWLPLFDRGYGYPIFSYHSPLFSWVGAFFLAATRLPVLSLKLAVAVFFAVGGLGCRTLAADFWGRAGARDLDAGDLAFAGWGSATYLLTNVFVRGSLAEFAASCFVPWVVWGLWLLTADARRYLAGTCVLAISLALVVLSHNAIAVYTLMLLALPLPLLLRPSGWRGWLSWAAGGVLAGCLSAFFAVSAVRERSFVRLDHVLVRDLHDHFLRVDHLLSLGQWNLGISCQDPGCTMPRHQGALLPFALLAGAAAFRVFGSKALRARTATALALVGLTLAMAMPPSAWIWDHLPVLQYTQFPWRWLSLNSVMLALLVPAFGLALRLHGGDVAQRSHGVAVGAIFLLNVGLYGGPGVKWPRWEFDPRPALMRAHQALTALDDEYGPVWRPTNHAHAVPADDAVAQGVALQKAELPGSPWRWQVGDRAAPCQVTIGVNFFPAWRAYWSAGARREELPVENASGLVAVALPRGAPGHLELEFANTPTRRALKALSAASLLACAALVIGLWRRKRVAARRGALDAVGTGTMRELPSASPAPP